MKLFQTSCLVLTALAISLFHVTASASAAKIGDIVYLCYEKKDGTQGAAQAKLLDNLNPEEFGIKLLEQATGWSKYQSGNVGATVYQHAAMLARTPDECASAAIDPAEAGALLICRVQKGGVFQNFTVLDEEPCTKIVLGCRVTEGEKSCPVAYVWPSGSKTVVEFSDESETFPIRINGNRAISPNAIADHTCILNTKTENLFCVVEPENVAASQQPKTNQATVIPESSATFSGIKAMVAKRWEEIHQDNVVIESIELVESEEFSLFGQKGMEAKFKSIVYIKKPFRGSCVSLRSCVVLAGINNDGLRTVPAGRYEDVSKVSFEKTTAGWKLLRD